MKIPILGQRVLFPTLRWQAYLAHAAVSPVSLPVQQAVSDYLALLAQDGAAAVGEILLQRQRLRVRLAELLGVAAERIGLDFGHHLRYQRRGPCSWNRGDSVILLRGEFPTNVTPWQRAAEGFDLGVAWLEADHFFDARGLEELEVLLRRGARLLAVSTIGSRARTAMPLQDIVELCHRYDCRVCVDDIQAAGIIPVNLVGVDFWAGGAHKWLMGLEGVGYLYVSPQAQGELSPRQAGWLSHLNPVRFLFEGGQLRYDRGLQPGPAFLEMGTWSGVGGAALLASLEHPAGVGDSHHLGTR